MRRRHVDDGLAAGRSTHPPSIVLLRSKRLLHALGLTRSLFACVAPRQAAGKLATYDRASSGAADAASTCRTARQDDGFLRARTRVAGSARQDRATLATRHHGGPPRRCAPSPFLRLPVAAAVV